MKSKVLSTRTDETGVLIRRTRLRDDGLRFTTVEIPVEIWNDYFKGTDRGGKPRFTAWLRRRQRTAQKLQAEKLFAEGWKLDAIESVVKIPARTLYDLRQRWREGRGVA